MKSLSWITFKCETASLFHRGQRACGYKEVLWRKSFKMILTIHILEEAPEADQSVQRRPNYLQSIVLDESGKLVHLLHHFVARIFLLDRFHTLLFLTCASLH